MLLWDETMPFLKGNTHMHTTDSDGDLSPEEAAAQYQSAGYDFVVQTDHWSVNQEGLYKDMLILPGIEMDVYPERQTAHILGIGVTSSVSDGLSRTSDAQQIIDAILDCGGAAVLAHPAWSLNTPEFIASLKGLSGTEIFNTFSGIPWNADRADSSQVLDITAAWGTLLPLLAADDSHRYSGEQCRSYTMVQANEKNREGIVAAIQAGRIYASQGLRIFYAEVTEDALILRHTPADRVVFYSNLPWVENRCRTGIGMTETIYRFDRERGEKYVRCEIIDHFGLKAWLSPVPIQ